MSLELDQLVQPDRVHRTVYTDQQIFDLEMERIFESTWVYCGHESQVREPGQFQTVQIGRQPMVMVRDKDGSIHVLYKDRKSTRLNSSHVSESRMPSSA